VAVTYRLMSSAETLAEELRDRGYDCAIGKTADGMVCIIRRGPNGDFEPPAEVQARIPRFPDNGEFAWQDAGGQLHSRSLDTSDTELAEAVVASIELINPA
jgi:hypothetical protein